MYKKTGIPEIEELLKSYKDRSKDLSSLKAIKIDNKRFCAWCGIGQLHHGNQKYCDKNCSFSAMASFYPQKEEGLNALLMRQDWKCNICQYDYAPLAQQISNKLAGYTYKGEDIPFKDKPNWGLIKRLKSGTPKSHEPEVDHIVPIYKGGQALGLDNHQAICYTCHKTKTKVDLSGKRKKNGIV